VPALPQGHRRRVDGNGRRPATACLAFLLDEERRYVELAWCYGTDSQVSAVILDAR
jgi:hypothetical protein